MDENFHREGGWLTKRCECSEPDPMTCGTCGRSWCWRCDRTPAARCPFEYEHKDESGSLPGEAETSHSPLDVSVAVVELAAELGGSVRADHAKRILDRMRELERGCEGRDDAGRCGN